MSSFQKAREIFNKKPSKEENKPKDIQPQPGKLSGDRMKFLQQINDSSKKDNLKDKSKDNNKVHNIINQEKKNLVKSPNKNDKLQEKEIPSKSNIINPNPNLNSINQRIDVFQKKNENKVEIKENNQSKVKIDFKGKLDIFNKPKNEQTKKENISKPIVKNPNPNLINEKLELLKKQNQTSNKVKEEKIQIEPKINFKDKINIFTNPKKDSITKEKDITSKPNIKPESKEENKNQVKTNLNERIDVFNKQKATNKSLITNKKEEPKIITGSQLISKENKDIIIYTYPNNKFSKALINNCKIFIFLGEKQEQFINSFINIYRDINYEDKERYQINNNDINYKYNIYYIKARSANYNIIIISIKYSWQNGEFIKDIMTIFNTNTIIPKRINYIFITLDNKNQLNEKGIITFLTIMNFFQKETIGNNIKIIFENDDPNFVPNENIAFNNYLNMPLDSLYKPQYLLINGKILYDKNSEKNKIQWNNLEENIKLIQNQLKSSKSLIFDKDKMTLFKDIFSNDGSFYRKLIRHFEKMKKIEQIYLIDFLLFCNVTYEMSSLILFLYNKIINNKKGININNTEIILVKDANIENTLFVLSKVKFKNLNYLYCQKCSLEDNSLKYIKNLYSKNLVSIDLSNNNLIEMETFNKEEALSNLEKLDLNNNKIKNINHLTNCNFANLKKLNLSHNLISDITCMQGGLKFNKLKELDLSDNRIKKLNKININTLSSLILLQNDISEGIIDFLNDFNYLIERLVLIKYNKELVFQYYDTNKKIIELKYPTKEENINGILTTISFKAIKDLDIIGFKNVDFLRNESLQYLKTLNFKEKIIDLSIFNEIKFKDLQRMTFCDDDFIIKGFSSLNIFSSIKVQKIKIEQMKFNEYKCYISCISPEFNRSFILNDLNFLKENFLENSYGIYISQNILDSNSDFFSYKEILNSFPIFKNLKAETLKISYKDKYKYICSIKFHKHNFSMDFCFDDMNFIYNDIFNELKQLSLTNIIFNDNFTLTKEKFAKLNNLYLYNNTIESSKIFSQVANISALITSDSNICKSELLSFMDNNMFSMEKICNEGNSIKVYYSKPFKFYLNLDNINDIHYFKGCEEIHLNNLGLDDEYIKFLNNGTLDGLKIINLDGNKITNLDIFDYIQSMEYIEKLSLKNNLINKGIEKINNNTYNLQNLEVKLNQDNPNTYIISFDYFKKFKDRYSDFLIYFDYLYDINNNLDILKILNIRSLICLNLSGIKLKNINCMENQMFRYISTLNFDNNLIEDISIFEKVNYYNNKISLKQNPIRKGFHVLKFPFFRCIYILLDLEKQGNEYKISASFKYPNIDLEFYINNINDIKNILDLNNTFIKLVKNNNEELKYLESELITSKSIENKKFFELILLVLDFFEKKDKIYINKQTDGANIIKENNILFNETNYDTLDKLFSFIQIRTAYFPSVSELIFENLENTDENLISKLTFLNISHLKLLNCNMNLNVLQNFHIKNLDLSKTVVTDIKEICNIAGIEILNLSNNENITNLYELKDAKFIGLRELYLSHCNIKDLREIKMNDYKFNELIVLDLSYNKINDLTPLKYCFKDLMTLNLDNNNIRDKGVVAEIMEINPYCSISLKGNDKYY